jgi:hypothetical protein
MKNQVLSANPSTSTLQEWASFLNVLNGNKNEKGALLKKAESPDRIVMHLEKQFSKIQQEPVFRRLGKHKQLALHFS